MTEEQAIDCVSRQVVKEGMIKYGFHAPDMTVTEFIEDELPPVIPKVPTSGDCVSRKDLLAQINESWETIETKLDFVNIVKASPSVKPKVSTSDDCVSRQAVLDLSDFVGTMPTIDHYGDTLEEVVSVEKIEALPLVTPTQGWIPVSERLPKVGEKVLCQCQANIFEILKLMVDGWYHDENHCYMSGFVIAWQPLPKPYEDKGGNKA